MRRTAPLLYLLPLFIFLLSSCGSSRSSSKSNQIGSRVPVAQTGGAHNAYIERFSQKALQNQHQFGIPASITLAQGILESASGRSTLARNANNHFGIKCHNSWRGGRTYHTDDRPNECFRVYNNPEESYEDHARFLQQPRYRSLFNLSPKDYKGWAKGLQKAGYATDKGYANKLIKIIEDNRLYLIDQDNPGRIYAYDQPKPTSPKKETTTPAKEREIYKSYGLLYLLAESGDDLATISKEMGISERKLQRYNDFPEGYPLEEGDVIYLQQKLKRAEPPHFRHTVQVGESIHEIAQKYGIRLDALYKINKLTDDYYPQEGDVLLLR